MHMLIRVVSETYDAEDATSIARGLFEGCDAPLHPEFARGTLMTEGGRWSQSFPESIQNEGSIHADSEIGNELIENAWISTTHELTRRMAVIRKGFEQFSDKELLEDPLVEVKCELWNPLGLAQSEEKFTDTYATEVRHAMSCVGDYTGPVYYLYNGYGTAIRKHSEYEQLLEKIATDDTENEDHSFFVTPVDAKY
jgi:hypothetical protein